jgi:hypothetical protein
MHMSEYMNGTDCNEPDEKYSYAILRQTRGDSETCVDGPTVRNTGLYAVSALSLKLTLLMIVNDLLDLNSSRERAALERPSFLGGRLVKGNRLCKVTDLLPNIGH